MHNPDPLKQRLALDKEKYLRKIHTKEVSDYNLKKHAVSVGVTSRTKYAGPTLVNEEDLADNIGSITAAQRTIYQGRSTENSYNDKDRFRTTNEIDFPKKEF